MAYLIRPGEATGKAVRGVLREQNARIIELLSSWESQPARAIHRARQACKRAQAVAQLLRPAMPYVAIVECLDYRQGQLTEPGFAESVAVLRESLAVRAVSEFERNLCNLRSQIDLACIDLRCADRRLAWAPLEDLVRRDLQRGPERMWRRC